MNTNKKLGQAAIETGAGTLIYTVPSTYKAEIKDINTANTTAGELTYSYSSCPVRRFCFNVKTATSSD